jgi:hypothetical protein
MAKKATAAKTARPSKGKTIKVPLHSVVHFVKMLQDEGHADKFVKAAKKSKAVMAMDSNSVGFVKSYLSSNQLHQAMVANVIDPCPDDPFECHFRN